jgi:hypothetical protein
MDQLDLLAAKFKQWVEHRIGISPLYEALVEQLVCDRDLLTLISDVGDLPFIYNRFMGAVHYLLLEGANDNLRSYYATMEPRPGPINEAYPDFRRFCFENKILIRDLMLSREVQINEVRRCAALVPALATIWQRQQAVPLALLDIGACAGLNLLFDRYSYDYGVAGSIQAGAASVQISCEPRGSKLPLVPSSFPEVVWRKGIDTNPIDVADPHATNWLIALVSPDDESRLRLLKSALRVAHEEPPILVKGAATDLIGKALLEIPDELSICVFHSFTMQDLERDGRRSQFEAQLAEFGKKRSFHVISLEWRTLNSKPLTQQPIPLELVSYGPGRMSKDTLALFDNRGGCDWIEWL